MSLPEENEIRGRTAGNNSLDHDIVLSKNCGGDGCEIPLFYDHNLRSEWPSAENLSGNNPIFHPPPTFSGSGLELYANPVTLPHGPWNQLEPSFPNHLDQINLGLSSSDEYLRHPIEFLSPCNQPESLSFNDYSHPVIHSSPNGHLSEPESLLAFENHSPIGSAFHPTSSNGNIFSKVATGPEISRYVSLGQELSPGLSSCSSGSHLTMLPIPPGPGHDYHGLETCRAALPPLPSFKKPLPILSTTGVTPYNALEVKESFPGFEGSAAGMATHDFGTLPHNCATKYPSNIEGFLDTAESCHMQPTWDLRTHSSSSRSSSYEQSNSEVARYPEVVTPNCFSSSTPTLIPSLSSSTVFNAKVLARGSSREPERSSHHKTQEQVPKASASRDHQNNQRRMGSLIDIHHLTNHVPRRRLTVEQEQILLRRFAVQEYLSKREMEELAEKLKIPTSQLRTWFGNRRSKLKAAARQKAKMEAGMGHLTDAELRNLNKRT